MGGKYRGKHAAGNVERPAADPVDEIPEDERLENQAKGRRAANDVKEGAERLKDTFRG